jgi:hypothetical protein
MLLYYLISLTAGVGVGYNVPAHGFLDVNSGVVFNVFINRHTRISDMMFGFQGAFHSGENPGYAFNRYGLQCGFAKHQWRISPIFEFGIEYGTRKLAPGRETGFLFKYSTGAMINVEVDKIRLSPMCIYEGLTDFRVHGGLIGLRLEVGYDF